MGERERDRDDHDTEQHGQDKCDRAPFLAEESPIHLEKELT